LARRLLALCTVFALGIFETRPPMAVASELVIQLNWTSPGDDGWLGRAAQYDVRVSRTPITESNFSLAGKVAGFLVPAAGRTETLMVTGLTPGVDYYFAVKTRDETGNWSAISNVILWSDKILNSEPTPRMTLEFTAPQPNPARSQARFSMTLPTDDLVSIDVFDLTGRRVRSLARGEETAGIHDLTWNLTDESGRRVPVGVYLVRARLGRTAFTRRLSVVR